MFQINVLIKKGQVEKNVLYSLEEIHMTTFMIGSVIMSNIRV